MHSVCQSNYICFVLFSKATVIVPQLSFISLCAVSWLFWFVVTNNASDLLERRVSEMTTHSLTHSSKENTETVLIHCSNMAKKHRLPAIHNVTFKSRFTQDYRKWYHSVAFPSVSVVTSALGYTTADDHD